MCIVRKRIILENCKLKNIKKPLGIPRRRWENNIIIDLREIGWGGMDRTDLAQEKDQWKALVNTVINLQVP
jgi:hypothetical protein